ncbi:MAG: 23S rRNA (adenine(2030)-N(6))-methyltransferase RlmJ [Rhizobiaceae bacterium]|nr:23S rRNA (adenine(2030)-N(6))-methyltransferase RlmJ [Rhizobiaceae bacterium]
MNYRHSFHAGNFADVMKHVTLCRLLEYLKRKDKPFRVIDTHAGAGLYDLSGGDSARTGEWLGGIGRLEDAALDAPLAALLAPYLEAVSAAREAGASLYPGSPWITRHLLRRSDRLTAIELHPQDFLLLKQLFAGDIQVRTIQLDGWLSLGAHVPPKEKRGLILVDPPFEQQGEFERMLDGAVKAHRRWPGGVQALWYPVKDRKAVASFRDGLAASGIPKILDLSLMIRTRSGTPSLDGCGMVVINPPFVLEQEMRVILPALCRLLGDPSGASWNTRWLSASETSA